MLRRMHLEAVFAIAILSVMVILLIILVFRVLFICRSIVMVRCTCEQIHTAGHFQDSINHRMRSHHHDQSPCHTLPPHPLQTHGHCSYARRLQAHTVLYAQLK